MTVPAPETHHDAFADPAAERAVPASFQRDFWVPFLRDCHGFDAGVVAEKSDAWIWQRAREVTDT